MWNDDDLFWTIPSGNSGLLRSEEERTLRLWKLGECIGDEITAPVEKAR